MLALYMQSKLVIVVCLALVSMVTSQMLHNKPIHSISVNGKYYDVVVGAGTEITFNAVVTDAGADLTTHAIEVMHPNGTMSYDGWLTDGDWKSDTPDNGSASTKTAKVTVVDEGTYTFKARATHAADALQYLSNILRVIIRPPETLHAEDYVPDTVLYSDGTVNRTAYELYWSSWSPSAQAKRFGLSFKELHTTFAEDRPTNAQPGTFTCPTSYKNKYSPYELGRQGCGSDDVSWSSVGQVGYIPMLPGDPGMDRVQTLAYNSNVFALSPRLDQTSGMPHPDPTVRVSEYQGKAQFPVASIRNYAQVQMEALTIYRSGLLGVNGLQSSRGNGDRPYPGIVFPSHLIPTDVAVTSGNELAVVTLWDTDTLTGKLAVVAIEAKYLPLYTTPYLGMPNQGSFSDLVLLGYVDLPIAAPTSVSAASNHRWSGPSDTNDLTLGQLDFTSVNVRQSLYSGAWSSVVATKGYAIVASKLENKVCVVDLSPVLQSFREAWLVNYNSTLEGRASGTWPASFDFSTPTSAGNTPSDSMTSDASRLGWSDLLDSIRALWSVSSKEERHVEDEFIAFRQAKKRYTVPAPHVVATFDLDSPTAVFAGKAINATSSDRFKAHVALSKGKVVIIDTSSLMSRSADDVSDVKVMGSFNVCVVPTAIVPARFAQQRLPLLPANEQSDPLNNHFHVVCRGSREIASVITHGDQGAVYQRLTDIRLEDPVNAVVADRANVLTVADFNGRKIVSFLIGSVTDRQNRQYNAPASGYQYVGEMPLDGCPFAISVAPVN
jgi:hypothetical protein